MVCSLSLSLSPATIECLSELPCRLGTQYRDLTQSGHVKSRQNSNNETRERRFELEDNTCTIPVRRQANAPLFAVNCKAKLPIKLSRRKVRFSQSFLNRFDCDVTGPG